MRGFLKIVVAGTLLFLGVAIVQEWDYFSNAWFGDPPPPSSLSEADRKEAADTVYELLRLTEHYYGTAGDSRFADRMPASEAVLDAMQADVDYLARNHRVQVPSLTRLELSAVDELGPNAVEVRTRELWSVRMLWSLGGEEAETPRVQVVHARYRLSYNGRAWRVEAWEVREPEPEPVTMERQ